MNAIRAKANEAKTNNKQLLCNLVVDEMAIRKHLEWDGKKFRGYVDIGNEIDDDSNAVASEALVFMLVSLDSHWKVPCGYFFDQWSFRKRACEHCEALSDEVA